LAAEQPALPPPQRLSPAELEKKRFQFNPLLHRLRRPLQALGRQLLLLERVTALDTNAILKQETAQLLDVLVVQLIHLSKKHAAKGFEPLLEIAFRLLHKLVAASSQSSTFFPGIKNERGLAFSTTLNKYALPTIAIRGLSKSICSQILESKTTSSRLVERGLSLLSRLYESETYLLHLLYQKDETTTTATTASPAGHTTGGGGSGVATTASTSSFTFFPASVENATAWPSAVPQVFRFNPAVKLDTLLIKLSEELSELAKSVQSRSTSAERKGEQAGQHDDAENDEAENDKKAEYRQAAETCCLVGTLSIRILRDARACSFDLFRVLGKQGREKLDKVLTLGGEILAAPKVIEALGKGGSVEYPTSISLLLQARLASVTEQWRSECERGPIPTADAHQPAIQVEKSAPVPSFVIENKSRGGSLLPVAQDYSAASSSSSSSQLSRENNANKMFSTAPRVSLEQILRGVSELELSPEWQRFAILEKSLPGEADWVFDTSVDRHKQAVLQERNSVRKKQRLNEALEGQVMRITGNIIAETKPRRRNSSL
ncbi:unnamed protein product, partial [Amoebophrya sp. A25]